MSLPPPRTPPPAAASKLGPPDRAHPHLGPGAPTHAEAPCPPGGAGPALINSPSLPRDITGFSKLMAGGFLVSLERPPGKRGGPGVEGRAGRLQALACRGSPHPKACGLGGMRGRHPPASYRREKARRVIPD